MVHTMRELCEQVHRQVHKCIAESEPLRHLVNAKKEMLLALRAVLDAKIQRLEKLLEPPEEPAGREVPVE